RLAGVGRAHATTRRDPRRRAQVIRMRSVSRMIEISGLTRLVSSESIVFGRGGSELSMKIRVVLVLLGVSGLCALASCSSSHGSETRLDADVDADADPDPDPDECEDDYSHVDCFGGWS